MPLPPGLKFRDRVASTDDAGYFACQRAGHRRVSRSFPSERAAREFRTAHDATFHSRLLSDLGITPVANVSLTEAIEDWRKHIRALEKEGKRSPKTSQHYEMVCDYLARAIAEFNIRTANELTPERVSQLVRWFDKNTDTEGALIVKSLSALKTIARWKGQRADWKIPHDEIQAKKRTKKDLDSETIVKLIGAMPAGSVEEAAAYLKARTGARDIEIYDARKEDFDLQVGVFAPELHAKRGKKKRHAYALTADAIEKIRPFVNKAKPGRRVFVDESGKALTQESMRPRVRAAAKRAGFVALKKDRKKKKPVRIGAIDSLAQIRAEVVTIIEGESSIEDAARHIGHASPKTSERWYVKDRLTLKKLEDRRRTAEIVARAIPLR